MSSAITIDRAMTTTLATLFSCAALLLGAPLSAQSGEAGDAQDPTTEKTSEQLADEFLSNFDLVTGVADIASVAEVTLPEGWRWAKGPDAQRMLEAFGNPKDPTVLGLAIPTDYAESGTFMVYQYNDDGHIDDEEPDYDELLTSMQEDTALASAERKKAGYQGMELLGWAEPPHYDKATHKLYWAKKIQFEGEASPTLNYHVRVLGRTGDVEITGVGDISQLRLVDEQCKQLLRATEFVDGQRYSDFDPAYDKVAAYGIGGLIAGKVLLKTGLFAKLGILLVKFLKPILVGVAVLGGLLWKLLGGRSKNADEQVQPAVEE